MACRPPRFVNITPLGVHCALLSPCLWWGEFFVEEVNLLPAQYKIDEVQNLTELMEGCEAMFIAEYRGLSVAQTSALRKAVRDAGGSVRIARNTLVSLVMNNLKMPVPEDLMVGPNLFVVAPTDCPAVAKALKDFASQKENKAFTLKGGVMGDSVMNSAQVEALASLPSKDQLRAQVVGTMVAPIRGLVTVLSGPARGLVTALSALADKKGKEAA